MNKLLKALLIGSLSLGLLAGCAQTSSHPMDMTAALHAAKTSADYEALATHYDSVAADMEKKAAEHRQLLADLRKDPHDYPKSYLGGNFENHCKRLIDLYERAAQANREMAQSHRQTANSFK